MKICEKCEMRETCKVALNTLGIERIESKSPECPLKQIKEIEE